MFEYELIGIGEEPVAEDNLVIECQARKTVKREIEIKNTTEKTLLYRVETDLVYATGPTTLTIPPNKKAIYPISITPVLSGSFTGSISFTDEENRYLWYTVQLETESPKSEKTVTLISQVRQAVAVEIEMENPLSESVLFEVIIQGEFLIGSESF